MFLRRIAAVAMLMMVGVSSVHAQEGSTLAGGFGDSLGQAMEITAMVERPLYTRTISGISQYTKAANDPVMSCDNHEQSVWQTFVASQTGRMTVHTSGSSFDTTMAVYRNSATAANEIACNNDANVGVPISSVDFPIQAGTRYYVLLGAHESVNAGDGSSLMVNYVSNRTVPNAFVIPASGNYSNVQEMMETAIEVNLPVSCGFHSHGVWYSFRPSTSRQYEFSTAGSSYDTIMAVVRRSDMSVLACNDDAPTDNRFSRIRINLTANTRYLIFIGKYGGASANDDDFTLSFRARPM